MSREHLKSKHGWTRIGFSHENCRKHQKYQMVGNGLCYSSRPISFLNFLDFKWTK